MAQAVRVTVLPEAEHAFLEDVFARAVRAGVIDPDELAISGAVWQRLRTAPLRTPEPPSPAEPPEQS